MDTKLATNSSSNNFHHHHHHQSSLLVNNNTNKEEEEEDCVQYEDCLINENDSLSPLHQQYASYNILDQDIDDQIATINSLTISDQQHPMDNLLDT